MKIRTQHVSNSSSSSFVLDTHYLSAHMIEQLFNHIKVAQAEYDKIGKSYASDDDGWNVKHIGKDRIAVYTSMDNFDMHYFFEFIGVPKEAVIEEDDNGYRYM